MANHSLPRGKDLSRGKAQARGRKARARGLGAQESAKRPISNPSQKGATPTTEEVKCTHCPVYNRTSRAHCRSCGWALPQRSSHHKMHVPSLGQAQGTSTATCCSAVASFGFSYACVVEDGTGQADAKKDSKVVMS